MALVERSARDHMTLANILPPLFINVNILTIWSVYVSLHLAPMLQIGVTDGTFDEALFRQGVRQTAISQFLIFMLIVCFVRAMVTHPGSTPDSPEWRMGESADSSKLPATREFKLTGERRHCKWCLKYKPDRCHHCRLCKTCVLRMDHHCPWIMNCVGWENHKFFFLLVVYTVLACVYVFATELETVLASVEKDMPLSNRFLLVLSLTLTVILGGLMTLFLTFHVWLMQNGMTTIEHCEKQSSQKVRVETSSSPYDLGKFENVEQVLGPRPIFWFVPWSRPLGDGMTFKVQKSLLPVGVPPHCD